MAAASALSLVSKVEISVSCRRLADMDVMSKSDPMCVLYECPPGSDTFRELGRTEMLKDTLNPDFQHKFIVDFHFEEHQKVLFKLYDIDSASAKLSDHDFLGQFESSVGELVSRRRLEAPLAKSPKRGSSIIVTCLELQHCKEVLAASVAGHNLDKKDLLGKSDPYFEVYKPLNELLDLSAAQLASTKWTLVYRSDVVRKSLNPTWQPVSLKLSQLCNGNKDLVLHFRCMDWNKRSKHSLIGEFHASVRQLMEEASGGVVKKTLVKKKNKPAGELHFSQLRLLEEDSFIDYIQGGCELNFVVAIDFTASNGSPHTPGSLHYVSPSGALNEYELAIVSVGEIVQDYNSSRSFPALGFGARIPPRNDLSHSFPLSFDEAQPDCRGVAGLLHAYRQCLRRLTLHGPTNFSPVISRVMRSAAADQTGSSFWVLLVITDGIVTDFYETKRRIVEASRLPMAVIIVGVGQEDFGAMEELDADNQRLQVDGKVAEADIVQFVPLRDFRRPGADDVCKSALAKAVLEELPDQLCCWMRRRGLRARPPRERSDVDDLPQQLQQYQAQPPPPQGYQSPPPHQGYQAPPPHQGYQAPPPHQGYQAPPPHQGYQAPPPHQGYQAPPPHQGYQSPPPHQGYQSPPPHQGYQSPPPHQGYQSPPPQGYQSPPPQWYQAGGAQEQWQQQQQQQRSPPPSAPHM